MKNRIQFLLTSIIAIMLFSSFTFSPGNFTFKDNDQKKKKVHIVINKDGIKYLIDTTITGFDHDIIEEKIDSIIESMDIHLGKIGEMEDMINFDTLQLKELKKMEHSLAKLDSMKFHIHCFADSHGKDVFIFNDSMFSHAIKIPDLPPLPPMPKIKILRGTCDRYEFDPDDDDIISYDKKELSDGREKIVIIRKKKIED